MMASISIQNGHCTTFAFDFSKNLFRFFTYYKYSTCLEANNLTFFDPCYAPKDTYE